ncbi:hypothetical protein ALC53_05306 [Atta colombica]|uniref:Uncharacterized protein n=1 Tax=Atta colombica TaxID=520822 RepID=A0A195BI68_9HYME|nr:hypothetical protein ALC53_05306 [Atta colombica]
MEISDGVIISLVSHSLNVVVMFIGILRVSAILDRYYLAERGVAVRARNRERDLVPRAGRHHKNLYGPYRFPLTTHGERITYMDISRQVLCSLRDNESNEIVSQNGNR